MSYMGYFGFQSIPRSRCGSQKHRKQPCRTAELCNDRLRTSSDYQDKLVTGMINGICAYMDRP